MSLFEHALPVAAAEPKPPPAEGDDKKKKDDDKKQVVRTQMIPENPKDDLGYDPAKIPVEEIE